MSPGRIAAILFLLSIVTASAQTTPLTCGQPGTQGTVACFSPATNPQSTDIIYGMQATGPQRSPQTVRITPAQIVAAGGGGGGGGSTLTFGTHLTGTSYNGSAPITLGTDATSLNTPSTIVARDSSGNFSIGSISGSLLGHASLDLLLTGGTLTGSLILNADPTIALGAATKNYVDTHGGGGTPANPTATAGPAAVNGSATTYMRSDAAPAVQKGSNAQFGIIEGDGTTLTCVNGICSSIGASATSFTPGTTTIIGATAPCLLRNSASTTSDCLALNAGPAAAFANALNGSGGLLGFSLIGTSGGTLGLLNAANTWSGVQSFNDGDLSLKGSSSGATVLHAPATGGVSATLPAGTVTLLATNGSAAALTGLPLTTGVTGLLPVANGGTGTASPGLVAGTNISSITGTWPNQTINASGGGGSVSITSLTPNIVVAPSPITGTGTVSSVVPLNTQSGASYAILTGDNTKLVEMTNGSATTMTIAVAGSAGFTSGWGASVLPTLAATTLTPASGTVCGLASISVQPGQLLSIATRELTTTAP